MAQVTRTALCLLAATTVAIVARPAAADPPKAKNATKGQTQIAGGNAEFGTIYSIKGFNFEILSAKYSIEPFNSSSPLPANRGTKLVILAIAVKNAAPVDNAYNDDYMFSLVDSAGQVYTGHSREIASWGSKSFGTSLRPGQGLGQPALHDPFTLAFQIPGNSRIVKVMINTGRLGRNEQAFRYYIAGATKEEAGEAGDPKNVIVPLPMASCDPSDMSGATLADVGKGTIETYLPSGFFYLRLDGFTYSDDKIYNGGGPPAGKKFAIATLTAKCSADTRLDLGHVSGGDFNVETTDGDRIKPDGFKKATKDANADHVFEQGDEFAFRAFFIVDKDAVVKKLVIGSSNANRWGFEVSAIH